MTGDRPRFSIIVPTYQGGDALLATLRSLSGLHAPWPVEVLVVVDGSTDGSAEAAAAVGGPLLTRVVVQPNSGAAAARNRGAREARGDLLLFLDDDMLADPGLLVAHDARHRAGAGAVVGHIPLAPGAPRTHLTRGYAQWADGRAARLAASGGAVTVADLLTGQLSLAADLFTELGGFDETLTADGRFGGEDTDFLVRLSRSGREVVFAPDAVSAQQYEVDALRYLGQWEEAGRTDTVLARRHPGLGGETWVQHAGNGRTARTARWVGPRLPGGLLSVVDRWAAGRVTAGHLDAVTARSYTALRDLHYWRGVQLGGGLHRGQPTLAVLAYHAIEDVDDPRTGQYAVPPEALRAQLTALRAAGWRFLTGQQFLDHLEGHTPVTGNGVLLTFDDGYVSVLESAVPVMRELGAVGVAFVVSSLVGEHNAWDAATGARPLPLLDVAGLQELAGAGWELGAHSRSHAHLPHLADDALADELAGARQELAALGLGTPRFSAHPFGEHDRRVRAAAAAAGYDASFALVTGRARARRADRHAVPRIEVQRDTTVPELLALVDRPLVAPHAAGRQVARAVARAVARRLRRIPGWGHPRGRRGANAPRRGDAAAGPLSGPSGTGDPVPSREG
ncbi:glycosyltransferase [Modestobacter sp. SSW1-42]|uniref:glycosyltransferase n=1 Tax=Modestobacter sp. SSW1-42 TaxID=596372 RepID=UPI0039877651